MVENSKRTIDDGNCPICGYFIGASDTCIRCGARTNKKMSIKFIRLIAIFGSLIGVFLFWFAVKSKEPYLIKISTMSETMNNAYVKVSGKIVSVRIDEAKNNFKFALDDGTGKINISCFNKYDKFKEVLGDNIPNFGDEIEVKGSLNISQAWGPSMFLTVPERIKMIKKYQPQLKFISEITSDLKDEVLKLKVSVIDFTSFTTRKNTKIYKVLLRDDSAEKEMVLFEKEFSSLPENFQKLLSSAGNELELIVKIGLYKGEPQIKLFPNLIKDFVKYIGKVEISPSEKKYQTYSKSNYSKNKTSKKDYKPVPIETIKNYDIGKLANIKAVIKQIKENRGGVVLTVYDATGEINLFISNKLIQRIENFESKINNNVEISGLCKVGEFRNIKQLSLVTHKNFKINIPKNNSDNQDFSNIQTKLLSEINKDMINTKVKIDDVLIMEIKYLETGKYKGSASIMLEQNGVEMTMFASKYIISKIENFSEKVEVGAKIGCIVKVSQYKGNLQISLSSEKNFEVK